MSSIFEVIQYIIPPCAASFLASVLAPACMYMLICLLSFLLPFCLSWWATSCMTYCYISCHHVLTLCSGPVVCCLLTAQQHYRYKNRLLESIIILSFSPCLFSKVLWLSLYLSWFIGAFFILSIVHLMALLNYNVTRLASFGPSSVDPVCGKARSAYLFPSVHFFIVHVIKFMQDFYLSIALIVVWCWCCLLYIQIAAKCFESLWKKLFWCLILLDSWRSVYANFWNWNEYSNTIYSHLNGPKPMSWKYPLKLMFTRNTLLQMTGELYTLIIGEYLSNEP